MLPNSRQRFGCAFYFLFDISCLHLCLNAYYFGFLYEAAKSFLLLAALVSMRMRAFECVYDLYMYMYVYKFINFILMQYVYKIDNKKN